MVINKFDSLVLGHCINLEATPHALHKETMSHGALTTAFLVLTLSVSLSDYTARDILYKQNVQV